VLKLDTRTAPFGLLTLFVGAGNTLTGEHKATCKDNETRKIVLVR